jgi:FkbM family methyltransferase
MRIVIARFFKLLFRFHFFRKRYYGIVFRIFQPLNLFRNVTLVTRYDRDMKMKLDLDEWIQQHIYFLGHFDPYGILFLKKNLKEGDVFVDAGANVGSYTLIAAKQTGKTGRVFAFEPAGEIYNRLCENVSLNKYGSIQTEKKALYDKNTTLDLFLANKMNLGMSSIYHHDTESGMTERVEAIKLDDYIDSQNINCIDLIKIDIEGSEIFALRGMKKILEKFRPKILIELKEETHIQSEFSIDDIINFLSRLGYEQWIIDGKGEYSRDIKNKPAEYFNFLFLPASTEPDE